MAAYNNHPLPTPPEGERELLAAQNGNHYYQSQQQQPPPQPPPHQQQYPVQVQAQAQYQHEYAQQQASPPQQPQQQEAPKRPSNQSRRSRGFSHKSDRSNDLHETSAEKEAKRLHSKADPTLAISEMEPSAVAAGVRSSLASVRDIQHRDQLGQLITEPDRSNPTRWRFERPLATINSFQEAIDSGYAREATSRRQSMAPGIAPEHIIIKRMQAQAHNALGTVDRFNARASVITSREYNRNSYYGNRPASTIYGQDYEQDEYLGPRQHSYGYPNAVQQPWPPSGHPPRRGPPHRMSSEPQFRGPRQPNLYPSSGNQQSRETIASGSGSGMSGEQAGYQTDPTSDNSSIDRKQSPPQPVNDYGIGFSQSSSHPAAFTVGIKSPNIAGPSFGGYQNVPRSNYINAPPVPQKEMNPKGAILRKPTASSIGHTQQRPAAPEKRQSWFGRHFSKKN